MRIVFLSCCSVTIEIVSDDIDPNEFAAEILLNAMDKAAGEDWNNFEDALAYINFDNKFPLPNHKENETDEEDQEFEDEVNLAPLSVISASSPFAIPSLQTLTAPSKSP